MIAGCRFWTCRLVYSGLKGAGSINRANYETIHASPFRVPLIFSLNPRQRGASVCHFSRMPGCAIVRAHFHAPNSASATKRNTAEIDWHPKVEWLMKIRRVKSGGRIDFKLWSPPLFFVKLLGGAVPQLNLSEPLDALFAYHAGHNHPKRKAMTHRQWFAIHFICENGRGAHCKLDRNVVSVCISTVKYHLHNIRLRASRLN